MSRERSRNACGWYGRPVPLPLRATDARQACAELVRATAICEEHIVEALYAAGSFRTVPLDGDRRGEGDLCVADRIGIEDDGFDRVECLTAINAVLPMLSADEKLVLILHFMDGLSQRQIAPRIGISRSQVGRVLDPPMHQLRQATDEESIAA